MALTLRLALSLLGKLVPAGFIPPTRDAILRTGGASNILRTGGASGILRTGA